MSWTDHYEPNGAALRRVTAVHRAVYRVTGGRLGSHARAKPVLLLTTTGRRTGAPRAAPLPYLAVESADAAGGEAWAVVASFGGRDVHPAWFRNLEAAPDAVVQIGRRAYRARAEVAAGTARAALWERIGEWAPWYPQYQAMTEREIPVVVLVPRDRLPGVRRPAAGWWIAVLGGMAVLAAVAYVPPVHRWWRRASRVPVAPGAYRALLGAAVATHAVEAAAAARLAWRAGPGTDVPGWTLQTMALGFPSLRLLRAGTANGDGGRGRPAGPPAAGH